LLPVLFFEDKEIYYPFASNQHIVMKVNSLGVFCGSKNGHNPLFAKHAASLGMLLANNNITLVYGGGSKGLMGILADAMMENNGNVTGVIPKILLDWEHQHEGITQLLVVEDMHVRKKKMYELSDAALILPGGFGTLDELFELLTWNQLAIHSKPIFLLNSDGFYNSLVEHIRQIEKNGFLYEPVDKRIKVISNPDELIPYIIS
jgi:uncharacterized protein (TIGR00730 family)